MGNEKIGKWRLVMKRSVSSQDFCWLREQPTSPGSLSKQGAAQQIVILGILIVCEAVSFSLLLLYFALFCFFTSRILLNPHTYRGALWPEVPEWCCRFLCCAPCMQHFTNSSLMYSQVGSAVHRVLWVLTQVQGNLLLIGWAEILINFIYGKLLSL